MNGPTHVPIHPKFQTKQFGSNIFSRVSPASPKSMRNETSQARHSENGRQQFQQTRMHEQDQDANDQFEFDDFLKDDDGTSGHHMTDQTIKEKKSYDWIIMFMAIIIVVLILVVIWLVLSNNDDPVPEKIISSQYMRPPGMNQKNQFPQQQFPQQQFPQQQFPQQQFPQQQFPQQQFPNDQQTPNEQVNKPQYSDARPTAQELDNVMNTLKKKNKNNEELSVDEYATEESPTNFQEIYEQDAVENTPIVSEFEDN